MKFASFLVAPKNIHFESQIPDEKIILFLRKHPVTQLSWILLTAGLAAAPLIVLPIIFSIDLLPLISTSLIVYLTVFWYVGTFGYAFTSFILWYFNVNIVTDRRIVDIDFPYLLYKESTATRFEQVEDLTIRRAGFIRTSFDFGSIFIQTAGAEPNLEFIDIPAPSEAVQKIVDVWQTKRPKRAAAFVNSDAE